MGLMLAEPVFHTRCFVEWEQYPRDTLIAAQRAGYFAPAPIWDDVTIFDAKPLAGAIDTVLAGYPCQPFSAAGQRKGENDERHLWPDIERIIRELGPTLRWCFFENVAGHLSLGLDTVLRSLRDMGFTTASGLFSAEEVGAPHERLRVFIVAYRESQRTGEPDNPERPKPWQHARRGPGGGSRGLHGELPNASQPGPQRREQCGTSGQRDGTKAPGPAAELCRPLIFPPGPSDRAAWLATIAMAPDLAPAVAFGDVARRADQLAQMVASGRMAETQAEPALCRMVDGLAQRSRALRLLGNGVVPLAAAYAWRSLCAAHGLGWVDLERADGCNRNPR